MFSGMHKFNSGGVEIAYQTAGDGPPILLIHGFASNARVNWWDTSWVKTLTDAGRHVISFDHRGHGASQKLYDPALYPAAEMAEDARRLLDHLGIVQADVMGYSMGARITVAMALEDYDAAIGAVERLIFYDPDNAALQIEAARLYMQIKSYAAASGYLTEVKALPG